MNKAAVYNQSGEKVSDLDLNPKIFGLEELDANLVWAAVRTQRNNARRSIAHTKTRGEVAGTGKKPWKQKGTGRARAGSFRSPLWRHGGITFGPRNEVDWSLKMNRSAFRKALFTVLSDKIRDKKLVIVDKLENVAKSKELSGMLTRVADRAGLGKKFLLVIPTANREVERAGRNLSNAKVILANQLNILDLLKYDSIIMKDALDIIEKTYLKT
ncbi:MAG: 50S ribosomal protein L4 [Candidatus Doudnabacteria bacterium]|nr:50S ribosomal protein L4 [Candidatus Doudnabacteria bacterium]